MTQKNTKHYVVQDKLLRNIKNYFSILYHPALHYEQRGGILYAVYMPITSATCAVYRLSGKDNPPVAFATIKDGILGKKYNLTLVFESTERAIELHKTFKKKDDPANILSFPYSDTEGEIIMHLGSLRTEARQYNRGYLEHITFMFIHGCLHLKGYTHGSAMEREEKKYMKKFWNTHTSRTK